MTEARTKTLVYDGSCSLCARLSRLAQWRWLVGPATRQAFEHVEGVEASRLTAAGIHNELAVIERPGGAIRTGYDGILWLLCDGRLRWLVPLLAWGPIRAILRHDYRLVAYNRRILAPPTPAGIACACDPDLHRGYRWSFIVLALLWSALLGGLGLWLFGTHLSFAHRLGPDSLRHGASPLAGLAAGPVAWALGTLAAWDLPRHSRLDLLGHLAWIAAAMLLPLLATAVLVLLGLLLAAASGHLPADLLQAPALPAGLGALAWTLALPIAWRASHRRLRPLGVAKWRASLSALVLWMTPLAFPLTKLLQAHHVS